MTQKYVLKHIYGVNMDYTISSVLRMIRKLEDSLEVQCTLIEGRKRYLVCLIDEGGDDKTGVEIDGVHLGIAKNAGEVIEKIEEKLGAF